MNIDQLTDIAYEVAAELEPACSFDVFDVTDSQVIFQGEHGLKRISLSCLSNNSSVKAQIRKELGR